MPTTPSPEQEENASSASSPKAPSLWQTLDLPIIAIAIAIFIGGVISHRILTRPTLLQFEKANLSFKRPAGWLPGLRPSRPPAALAEPRASFGAPPARETPSEDFHTIFTSPSNPALRLEVRIAPPPTYKNLSGALSVARLGRYGESYWVRRSDSQSIAKRDWLRTEFRYAYKPTPSGSPQIAEAIEYATMNKEHLYIVVVHGEPNTMAEIDSLLRESLRINVAAEQP